jgi:hypothetical protein
MKTVMSTDHIKVTVSRKELIEGKWLYFNLLSKKLAETEERQNSKYKSLRNKMYNSKACGKYNTETVAGLSCINVLEPMKGRASLELEFEVTA